MKIFEDTYKIEDSKYLNDIGENDLFFDLETTGLSRRFCHIYMIGCGYIIENEFHTRLYFAEDITEERQIVNEFIKDTRSFERLITYNGNRFDIPFFKERIKDLCINFDMNSFDSLDIYARAKKLKHLLLLPGLKQKDIEHFLGIKREDKYDGGKLIEVYKEYQIRPSDESEFLLMIHNKEDVIGMSKLLPILSYEALKDINLEDLKTESTNTKLLFKASFKLELPREIRIQNDEMYLIIGANYIKGSLNIYDGYIKKYFPNYKDYLYHIADKQIIPKVLVSKADKDKYRKATKEECYINIKTEEFNDKMLIENIMASIQNCY
ncbi:MAG: ribonuclease H-like domain-containing protein [Lachnospiraceae bacterium]|nr:ribonuclease H-like domain-containing protein [Lachnospiraceae bacterium]